MSDITSKLSNAQLEKVTASPTLKLPHLFSSTPNSSGKAGNAQRRQLISQVNQVENVAEVKPLDQSLPNSQVDSLPQGCSNHAFTSFFVMRGRILISTLNTEVLITVSFLHRH